MDFETQRKKRLEALEEKKKRLEEMKKIKQDRDAQSNSSISQGLNSAISQERHDVDDLVNSLLLSSNPASEDSTMKSTSPMKSVPKIDSNELQHFKTEKHKSTSLTIVKNVTNFEMIPKQVESYEKECQTDVIPDLVNTSIDLQNLSEGNFDMTPHKLSHRRPAAGAVSSLSTKPHSNTPSHTVSTSLVTKSTTGSAGTTKPELNEDEVKKIIKSENFLHFIDLSSHLVERAIGQTQMFDLLRDYQKDRMSEQKHSKKSVNFAGIFTDESVRYRPIMDIQFSPHFPELFLVAYGTKTSSISTSHLPSKKSGTSNHNASTDDSEPLGMVCVWSTGVDTKPEFKFYSSSPILAARFSTTDEHIIFGGCYTGQILMWDMRAKSQPVQRSSLTGNGHKHPIYSMSFVPSVTLSHSSTSSSNTSTSASSGSPTHSAVLAAPVQTTSFELVTVSVDGVLCYWDVSRLVEPSNMVNLSSLFPSSTSTNISDTTAESSLNLGGSGSGTTNQLPLNITCMSFSSSVGNSQTPKEVIFGKFYFIS